MLETAGQKQLSTAPSDIANQIAFLARFVIVILGDLGIVPILAHHLVECRIRIARIEIGQKFLDLLKNVGPENGTLTVGLRKNEFAKFFSFWAQVSNAFGFNTV